MDTRDRAREPAGSGRTGAGRPQPDTPLPPPPRWTARAVLPDAVVLIGHAGGAAPLLLARNERAVPVALALAVLPARPPGPAAYPDPLRQEMRRLLEEGWRSGSPQPPLRCAWQASLSCGGWPRAAAAALGGLRWIAPHPDAVSHPAPLPGEGWPTPAAAAIAAAFVPLSESCRRGFARGLALVVPSQPPAPDPDPAALEWRWAARWRAGTGTEIEEVVRAERAALAELRALLPIEPPRPAPAPAAVDTAGRDPGATPPAPAAGAGAPVPGTGGGRRRPPENSPVQPHGPVPEGAGRAAAREAGGAAGASPAEPADPAARLAAAAARLGRLLNDRGLMPDAVRRSYQRLHDDLERLHPRGLAAWPAYHAALPAWCVWTPAADTAGQQELLATLRARGWTAWRLRPCDTGARVRLDAGGPAGTPPAPPGC